MTNRYWCVINWRNGGKPTVGHSSFEAAKAEAERLAAGSPGEYFTVFAAVGRAHISQPVRWEDL